MASTDLNAEQLQAFWAKHLERWRSSEQSQAAYCREHHLIVHRFRYWKERLEAKCSPPERPTTTTPAPLIPIHIKSDGSAGASEQSGVAVKLGGDIRIELSAGFDPRTLRAAVQALSG